MASTEMRGRLRRALAIFAAAAGAIGLLAVVADRVLAGYAPRPFYAAPEKIWAHRGYLVGGAPENTVAAFAAAFGRGAPGTELDVFYDSARDRYVVTHDEPRHFEAASVVTLEEVFAAVGAGKYFWLDFKNLAVLPRHEAERAASTLRRLLAAHDLDGRAIVESPGAENLAVFARAGVPTSYWVQIAPEENLARYLYHRTRIRLALFRGGFTALSMDYRQFTPRVERDFTGVAVHLFTVNDEALVAAYARKPQVRIVLSDLGRYDVPGK